MCVCVCARVEGGRGGGNEERCKKEARGVGVCALPFENEMGFDDDTQKHSHTQTQHTGKKGEIHPLRIKLLTSTDTS